MNIEYAPGQFEWTMKPTYGIRSPDNAFLYRSTVKEMAQKRGWLASFAAKPRKEYPCGNGCHWNHSLWSPSQTVDENDCGAFVGMDKKRTNVFYDAKEKDGLSQVAKYWMGGILKHLDALQAFCGPTVLLFLLAFGKWFLGTFCF